MGNKAMESNTKKTTRLLDILFVLLLFAFPFLHISTGISVSDTGYNLLNFSVFPNMNETWAVSTVLANVIGRFFSILPLGGTVLGLNIYCTILSGIFVSVIYFLLRRHYNSLPVFLGMFIALGFCWCPRTILYHYLTYYLFDLGAILLLLAIQKEKKALYFIAGGILALNLFVRFPNVTECLLIVVLIFHGILKKKNVWRKVMLCIGGYIAVFAAGFVLVSIAWGKDSFFAMIHSLFGMTKEATSYTPKAMLVKIFDDYRMYFKFFVPYLLCAVLCGVLFAFIKKKILRIIILVFEAIGFAGISLVLYRRYGAFNFTYNDYRSIFMFGTFMLMMAISLAVYGLFRKDISEERKLLGLTVLIIVLITPIGSNNGLYTAFNNMFLTGPFVIGEMFDVFAKDETAGRKTAFRTGVYISALLVCLFVLFQSTAFGITFVFHDASFTQAKFETVDNNPVMKGIRTEAKSAQSLQELNDYLDKNQLKHQKAICYNDTPGLFFYMEEECAISHSWPDLDSFPTEELKEDLERLNSEEVYPLFFGKADRDNYLTVDLSDLEKEKDKLFAQFLRENHYTIVFQNEKFVLYQKKSLLMTSNGTDYGYCTEE